MKPIGIDSLIECYKKSEILCSVESPNKMNPSEIQVSAVFTNSMQVQKNGLFIAYKGVSRDSHEFVESAILKGATVIVHDSIIEDYNAQVTYIQVKDSRHAWALTESSIRGNPQDSMEFIGITGTNGKTSTGWYAYQLLIQNNIPACLIGTLGIFMEDRVIENSHTTPDPDVLFEALNQCKQLGIKHIVMEVASQSIVHNKIAGLKFKTLVFTNFSRDHLDFHKDMKSYFAAKMKLFTHFASMDATFIIHKSIKEKFLSAISKKTVPVNTNIR